MYAINSLADLDFDRRPVQRLSSLGDLFTAWVPTGMPRIPTGLIDNTFFLFGSEEDAQRGRSPRGTGFFVAYERNVNFSGFVYAVSNWHVAVNGGASVIRLNAAEGMTAVYPFDPSEWFFNPRGPDIAVLPFEIDQKKHGHINPISDHLFAVEKSLFPIWDAGVGEDTFMVGMFVDQQAKNMNMPAARFGHVSMLPSPNALLKQPNGHHGSCFIVDMHSRTGFSGSPVFAYRTLGSDLATNSYAFDQLDIRYTNAYSTSRNSPPRMVGGSVTVSNMLRLLGVQCGQFPEYWPINGERVIVAGAESSSLPKGQYVEGVSGMTCVVPAWHIEELLNMPELKKIRNETARPHDALVPRAEIAPQTTDENPTHREDFTSLLNVASKTPKQDN